MTSSYQTVVDSTDEINKALHLEWERRLTGSALSIHTALYLHITHNSSVNNAYFSDFSTTKWIPIWFLYIFQLGY